MNNLKIALAYLKKGISVMPPWSPEMVKKHPRSSYRLVRDMAKR